MHVVSGNVVRLGYQQIALSSTPQFLTPPADARLAVIDTEVQNARWRDDGTAPTASEGMRLIADTEFNYSADTLTKIQFVAEIAGSVINVSYYR